MKLKQIRSVSSISAAATAARCIDFVEDLPQGWLTRLGGNGETLSGGQRQRISLARAFLKDSPIIVLDEPTSALDSESELAVQAAIDALVSDRTVIIITHRLSTIRAADQIVFIEDGIATGIGGHDVLLAEHAKYARLWSAFGAANDWKMQVDEQPHRRTHQNNVATPP